MASTELLYHYTTPPGLVSIFENECLWATNVEYLNDARELQFGRRELGDALARKYELTAAHLKMTHPNQGWKDPEYGRLGVIRVCMSLLESSQLEWEFTGSSPTQVFVSCFCEAGDLLSQWRGYGGSGGFALGFRASTLLSQLEGDARLLKVSYGEKAMWEVIPKVVERIGELATGSPGQTGFDEMLQHVVPDLASIKDAAFEEEREWRIILTGTQSKVRTGPLGLIPYCEIPLSFTDSLQEIVVGPGREQTLRVRALDVLLKQRLLHSVNVKTSTVPYRG